MRLLLVHAAHIWTRLLGTPAKGVDSAEAIRAGRETALRMPSLVAALADGHDLAVIVLDGADGWRKQLGEEDRDGRWPAEAWAPLRDVCERMTSADGYRMIEAPLYGDDAPAVDIAGQRVPLAGRRASARDVIATIVAWLTADADGGPSGRFTGVTVTAVPSLVDDASGIRIARDFRFRSERWEWTVEDASAIRKRLGYDPGLVADVEALASLPGIGDDGARFLVAGGKFGRMKEPAEGWDDAESAVAAAVDAHGRGERVPGMNTKQMAALVEAGANGGAGILRALAVKGLRTDAPGVAEMMAALCRGEDRERGAETFASVDGVRGEPAEECAQQAPHQVAREVAGAVPAGPVVGGIVPAGTVLRGATPVPSGAAARDQPEDRQDARGDVHAVAYRCANCAAGRCGGPLGDLCQDHGRCRCKHGRERLAEQGQREERETMTTKEPTALARRDAHEEIASPGDFGYEHMRIVREAFAPTASQAEFEVMWAGAKARGLDPVKKQIYFVKRWDEMRGCDVWSSQVSIDGFRSIAESSGKYDGQDEPEYEYNADGLLTLARVRVWKKGISRPFVGVARWDEYVQTKRGGEPTHMWRKMGHNQLGKCAEALALRKAFPEKLSGIYAPEEMDQAENVDDPATFRGVPAKAPPAPPPPAVSAARVIMDRVQRAETAEQLLDIVKEARAWPRVRAHAWLRMLSIANDAARVDETRTLYLVDELPDDIIGKLDVAASARLDDIEKAAA